MRLPLARLRSQRGQTLVEFAVAAPLVFLLLFGLIQFGIFFSRYLALNDAVRSAARTAIVSAQQPDPRAAAKDAAVAAATALDPATLRSNLSVGPDPAVAKWTSGSSVTVTGKYPYTFTLLGMPVGTVWIESSTTQRVE